MADADCSALGIPDRLHKGERDDIQNFTSDELLYRRFHALGDQESWKKDNKVSSSIFPLQNDSYNRSQFSFPDDVLYDDKGTHRPTDGILSVPVSDLLFAKDIDEKRGEIVTRRTFTILAKHLSLKCNYAHCELVVLENGKQIDVRKPTTVKLALREFLIDLSTILRDPGDT